MFHYFKDADHFDYGAIILCTTLYLGSLSALCREASIIQGTSSSILAWCSEQGPLKEYYGHPMKSSKVCKISSLSQSLQCKCLCNLGVATSLKLYLHTIPTHSDTFPAASYGVNCLTYIGNQNMPVSWLVSWLH